MDLTLIKLKDIKFSPFDKPKNNIPYDSKKYDWVRLSNSIKLNGFKPEKYGYMTISKNNYCLNGHHRYAVLKELYGENYELFVERKRLNYIPQITLDLGRFLILIPFILISKLLGYDKTNSKNIY